MGENNSVSDIAYVGRKWHNFTSASGITLKGKIIYYIDITEHNKAQACACFSGRIISLQGKYFCWYNEMISHNWNLVKWSYVIRVIVPNGTSHLFSMLAIPIMVSLLSVLCWLLYGERYCKDLCCGLHVSYSVLACGKPFAYLIQVRIHGYPRDIEWHLVFLGELWIPKIGYNNGMLGLCLTNMIWHMPFC